MNIRLYTTLVVLISLCLKTPAMAQSDTIGFPVPKYVGIHAGTQGLGVSAFIPVSASFTMQAGLSFLPVEKRVYMIYNSYNTRSFATARFSNVHLWMDWAPFRSSGNLLQHAVATAGLAYFFDADGRISTRLADKYYYGEIGVSPERVGVLTTNITWKSSVAPFLGIGLRNIEIIPKLGLGATLGSYYLRKPEVTMAGTNLLEGNEVNMPIVNENIKGYRFLPVLQLNFSYQIK